MRSVVRFTAGQASVASGVAYHQLNRWDVSGLLKPSVETANGKDSLRIYSLADVVALRVVRQLQIEGFRVETLTSVVSAIQGRRFTDDCDLYLIGTTGGAAKIGRVDDVNSVLLAREFSWVLDLGAIVREVSEAANNRVKATRGRASVVA